MRYKYRHLKVFRGAMIYESATGAAIEANITQPAASRTLKEFEEIVGFQLFERQRLGLRPTVEAQHLFEEVKRAYTAFNQVEQTAKEIKAKKIGRLRIAAMPVYADGLVSRLLAGFVEKYPGINVRLDSNTKADTENLVATDQVDIGVITLPTNSDMLRIETSIERAAVCVFPKDNPLAAKDTITVADLQYHRVVHLTKGSPLRSSLDLSFIEQGIDPIVEIEVGTQQAIVNIVAGGAGIGIVDPDIITDMDSRLIASRPLSPPLVWKLALISQKKGSVSTITSSFVDWVVNQV